MKFSSSRNQVIRCHITNVGREYIYLRNLQVPFYLNLTDSNYYCKQTITKLPHNTITNTDLQTNSHIHVQVVLSDRN